MIPKGHVEVREYDLNGIRTASLTRCGKDYFVRGRKVTLKKALLWMAKMEVETDSGGGNWRETAKFLTTCAKAMK
jgi:hypothetical protein